jgi:hypothetical protein
VRSLAAALAELDDCFRGDSPDELVPAVPPVPPVPAADPATTVEPFPVVPPVPTVPPTGVTVDGDVAELAALLDVFPDSEVTELRLDDPFGRMDLQRAFPDAAVVPLGDETPGAVVAEPWTWSVPLPPRRARAREPRAMPEGVPCRFCDEPVDLRETGGDPDGGWSHLGCWAEAGHPDVGHAKAVAAASPRAGTRTCKHCRGVIDWKRDGVAFGDGSGAHVACYERAG